MDENNKNLEDAANALNEAATTPEAPAEAPVEPKADDVKVEETPVEAPIENAGAEMKEEPKVEEAPAPETPAETPAEPASAETPAVEPAPTATPEPAPVAPVAPVVEAPAAAAPAVAPATPKKSKKGLIIGCTIGAVAVLGAGGFGLAYAMDSKPENVAISAITDFLGSKTMAVDGVIELSTNSKTSMIDSAKIELKSDKNTQNETSTTATLTVDVSGEELSISLGTVVMKDYTIYVQLNGLKEAAKQALEMAGSTSYEDYAEVYEDLIDAIVGEVDGVWWKIYVPDVLDEISEISSSQKKAYNSAYQCLTEAADRALAKQDKYADIYKENPFISLEEYSGSGKSSAKGTPYKIKLDSKKTTSFINAFAKEYVDTDFTDCIGKISGSSYSSSTEIEDVEESDVAKALEDFPEIVVTIDNGFFSHTLTGVYYSDSKAAIAAKSI